MPTFKIIEEYDGRLPIFNVVKEEIIKSFDSYEQAETYCNNLQTAPCGEEIP